MFNTLKLYNYNRMIIRCTVFDTVHTVFTWYIWRTISLANWDVMHIGGDFRLPNRAILSVHCS